jgi:hypothetical protein
VDGANMLDVWMGKSPGPDRTVFWEMEMPGESWKMHAAMRGDFKLLEIGGNRFLYNVKNDPGERRTLGAEYPEVMNGLRKELAAWLATARP